MNDLFQYPLAFWFSLAELLGVAYLGWRQRQRAWGFPAMTVCFTVIVWYHGDALYNDYAESYRSAFSLEVLDNAWLEVVLFALALGIFLCFVPDLINRKYRGRDSRVEALRLGRRSLDSIQSGVSELAYAVTLVWLVLFGVSLWRSNWDVPGLIAPYLGEQASVWGRSQIATSWFDSIASIVSQLLQVCAAIFGICAATLRNGLTRWLMFGLILVSWPAFFFDRTRYVMLLVLLPGLLAYVFLRLRGRHALQICLLVLAFLLVNGWFKFVIVNRSGISIAAAFASGPDSNDTNLTKTHHQGFNMFEELCWVNYLTDSGEFSPNWGMLYLANLVNPIPRALWHNKPTMGLDYAMARGQMGDIESGMSATIAVGMIGSGIVNFGKLLGPVAAAFLMTLWCAFLARLDLTGDDFGHLLIYMLGLITIFLFGRDITILLVYPTVFGLGLLWFWRKIAPQRRAHESNSREG